LKRAFSFLLLISTSIIREPWRSCITRPEVTMGEIPSSMRVPRLEAMTTRDQYQGSFSVPERIPYKGTCEHTKKMNRATAVHKNLSLNWISFSACWTSGTQAQNGARYGKILNDIVDFGGPCCFYSLISMLKDAKLLREQDEQS